MQSIENSDVQLLSDPNIASCAGRQFSVCCVGQGWMDYLHLCSQLQLITGRALFAARESADNLARSQGSGKLCGVDP